MSNDLVIVIRCFDNCVYRLAYPAFFLEAKKPAVRKILRYLYEFDWKNTETIAVVEREFPQFVDTVKALGNERVSEFERRLQECVEDYERDFLDPDPATFPSDWPAVKKRAEIKSRKEWNTPRMQRVKNAKVNLEQAKKQAKKDLERAKEVYEIYLAEKR